MTEGELLKLRESLPKGAVTQIAKLTNTSISLVSMVLRGNREDVNIIEAAIKLAASYQKRIKNNAKKIKQL